MGSWNHTCGISQLPIKAGEKIIAIPIVYKNYQPDSLYSYSDAIWKPSAWPVTGKYNDYGGIENMKVPCKNLFLQYFKRYHGFNGTIKHFEDGLRETSDRRSDNKITIKYGMKESVGSMFMIREDIWNAVMNMKIPSWDEKDTSLQSCKDQFKIFEQDIKDIRAIKKEDRFIEASKLRSGEKYFLGDLFNTLALFLIDEKIKDKEVSTIIEKSTEVYFLEQIMQNLRKLWIPQAGAGGQDQEWLLYAEFFKKAELIARTIKTKEDADW